MSADAPITVTLATGEVVDSSAPAWREECAQRWRHVLNLRRLNLHQRRDYIENVERKEGAESAHRLKHAFAADWAAQKQVLRAAAAGGEQTP